MSAGLPLNALFPLLVRMVFALAFCALATSGAFAAQGITTVEIDGNHVKDISRVTLRPDGRVMVIWSGGGGQYPANKFSKAFLSSWGIGTDQVDAAKQEEFESAVRTGKFRIVEGVVYDLRQKQATWTYFPNARLFQKIATGEALVDPTPDSPSLDVIHVENLPDILSDTERFSFFAKQTGTYEYINKRNDNRVVRSYDAGRAARRSQIPDEILKDGKAYAAMDSGRAVQNEALAELPQSDSLVGSGTGFFITEDGYFITNDHVVRGMRKVKVKHKSHVLHADVIKSDQAKDLALLKVHGDSFTALPVMFNKDAALGDEVFTIGFPNVTLQGMEPKYTDGRISSLSGFRDDPSQYQISVPVQPGNSGGALLDRSGHVVGIIVARLSDFAMLRSSGSIPQNVNYAIKTSALKDFLQSVRELDPITKGKSPAAKVPNAIQHGQSATALVLGYK